MNIILLSSFCKKKGSVELCVPGAAAWLLGLLGGFSAVLLWGGYQLGLHQAELQHVDAATTSIRSMLEDEREVVENTKAEQRAHLDALALRIASIQAHLMRVDALGDRLVRVGKLDAGEFDFETKPAMGGLDGSGESQDAAELSMDMARLSKLLDDREDKLMLLEQLLANNDLLAEMVPSGRPVKKGWLSSGYGKRTDPFTGKKRHHNGVDFAGQVGADVIAVASGVVVRAEKVAGFGNVVEIRHADGYVTRYAHNKVNKVSEGNMVNKGQVVALLGSSGRSSGPHVHFEVHKNGRSVNPRRFIQSR